MLCFGLDSKNTPPKLRYFFDYPVYLSVYEDTAGTCVYRCSLKIMSRKG